MKEKLENTISKASSSLLDMASDICWNKISRNSLYITSEIEVHPKGNFFEQAKNRKKINDKKVPKSISKIAKDLSLIYEDLYDINLYIFHAKRDKTIIEIRYFLKTSHTKDYYPTIKNNEPMLHCKVATPPYKIEGEKFDVNWELGGVRYEMNMFLGKLKNKLRELNRGMK